MQIGVCKPYKFSKTTNYIRPTGSRNFVIFEKLSRFTRAYQHQIVREILLLLILIIWKVELYTNWFHIAVGMCSSLQRFLLSPKFGCRLWSSTEKTNANMEAVLDYFIK